MSYLSVREAEAGASDRSLLASSVRVLAVGAGALALVAGVASGCAGSHHASSAKASHVAPAKIESDALVRLPRTEIDCVSAAVCRALAVRYPSADVVLTRSLARPAGTVDRGHWSTDGRTSVAIAFGPLTGR